MFRKMIVWALITWLSVGLIGSGLPKLAWAAERVEQATVVGKDKSEQPGAAPADAKSAPDETKMKKEKAPAGLKSDKPDMGAADKMEKPKAADRDVDKRKERDNTPVVKWFVSLLALAAIAAALK